MLCIQGLTHIALEKGHDLLQDHLSLAQQTPLDRQVAKLVLSRSHPICFGITVSLASLSKIVGVSTNVAALSLRCGNR